MNDQLLLQKRFLGDNSTAATGSDQFGDGVEQLEKQEKDISHAICGKYDMPFVATTNYLILVEKYECPIQRIKVREQILYA